MQKLHKLSAAQNAWSPTINVVQCPKKMLRGKIIKTQIPPPCAYHLFMSLPSDHQPAKAAPACHRIRQLAIAQMTRRRAHGSRAMYSANNKTYTEF